MVVLTAKPVKFVVFALTSELMPSVEQLSAAPLKHVNEYGPPRVAVAATFICGMGELMYGREAKSSARILPGIADSSTSARLLIRRGGWQGNGRQVPAFGDLSVSLNNRSLMFDNLRLSFNDRSEIVDERSVN